MEDKLAKVRAMINKKFDGAVTFASEIPDLEIIPTGSLLLNVATGVGGFPLGRSIELFGSEGGGKSTIALSVVAEAQKRGHHCVYLDTERVYSKERAAALGVDNNMLELVQVEGGEVGLDIVEAYIRSGAVRVVVVDSVAALAPMAELEGTMDDQNIGLQARLMSKAMRKLTGAMAKNRCMVIWINQLREKVGVMFGNPETTPGGRALKFYASMRIRVSGLKPFRVGTGDNAVEVGHSVKCQIVKNKLAAPYKIAQFNLYYDDRCIDNVDEMITLGISNGLITKSGAWLSYVTESGEEIKQQGASNFANTLREETEVFEELKSRLMAEYKPPSSSDEDAVEDGDYDDEESSTLFGA